MSIFILFVGTPVLVLLGTLALEVMQRTLIDAPQQAGPAPGTRP